MNAYTKTLRNVLIGLGCVAMLAACRSPAADCLADGGPRLSMDPEEITFELTGGDALTRWAEVSACGGEPTTVALETDAPWLTTAVDAGPLPAEIEYVVDTTASSAGSNTATLTASAPGFAPATLDVTLTTVTDHEASQIYLAWTEDPSTTLTVVWRTNSGNTPSELEVRPAGESAWTVAVGAQRPSGTTGVLHETTVRELEPGTAYEYRVRNDDGTWSRSHTTTTAPASSKEGFDAVYVADTGIIGRLDGLTTGTEQVIETIDALEPTVLLGGGDYAYFNTDDRYATLDDAIDAWIEQMQPIMVNVPFMPTYGNHEAFVPWSEEGYEPWAARFPTPEGWNDRRAYSFDIGDVHFMSILAFRETEAEPAALVDWIRADATAAADAGQRWLIAYFHAVPFSDGENHPSNLALRDQFGPVFEELGIDVAIFSHDQSYERTYPLTDVPTTNTPTSTGLSCYTKADGVTWMKVSPGGKVSNINAGFSPWMTTPPPSWTAARDNTMHHFLHLRVSELEIAFDVYGVVGDGSTPVVVDSFRYLDGVCP